MEAYSCMTPKRCKTVLVVQKDEETAVAPLQALKQQASYDVVFTTSGVQALQLVDTIKPDLLILSAQLPDMAGLEVYDWVNVMHGQKNIPTILLDANLPWHDLGKRNIICLSQPFNQDQFLQALDTLLLLPLCPVEAGTK